MLEIAGYTVHHLLGQGGMAKVYLATQNSLGREVAIKILLNPQDEQFSRRFLAEAKTIAALNHPRVITIYDVSQLRDGCLYFVMEYLNGGDLRQFKGRVLPPEQALAYVRQIAEGLSVIHSKNIIHRDVKPANVLLKDDANLVLTDFGIAKNATQDGDLTVDGSTLGSPSYSSPEQTTLGVFDHRADIYSLGVVLLEMLLGVNPYVGSTVTDTAVNHLQMDIPRLPSNLKMYQSLVDRMLAKQASERFDTADAVVRAVDQALGYALPEKAGFLFSLNSLQKTIKHLVNKQALIAVCAIFILVVFYFTVVYETESEKRIRGLLESASLSQQEARFDEPEGNNAEFYFKQVLLLDSDNRAANAGLKHLKSTQVRYYLNRADGFVETLQWDEPEDDCAVFLYHKVLHIEPENVRAKKGLVHLTKLYVDSAQKSFLEQDFQKAFHHLRQGLLLDPENATLLQLKNEYKSQSNSIKRLFNQIFK